MGTIRDLQVEENGLFAQGVFDSRSLFQGEMPVSIFVADGASEADAERCIEQYNALPEGGAIDDAIQRGLERFFLYMYDEWGAFDIYDGIAQSLIPIMDGYKNGARLISYLYKPSLAVYAQRNGEVGYGIECECPWEPEHMCLILVRNGEVVYVGPSEGQEPWDDEDEFYCIWNEE